MTQVNIGTTANDGTGNALRNAFQIVNDNFNEVAQSLTDLSTQLNNLDPASETYVDDAIEIVNTRITDINNTVSELDTRVADAELDIDNLQTALDGKATTAALNAAVASLNEAIASINTGQQGALPYLVYSALLSQSGTDDPTYKVLQNTLGTDVNWYRSDVGSYYAEIVDGYTNLDNIVVFGTINSNEGAGGTLTYEGGKYGLSISPYLRINTWSNDTLTPRIDLYDNLLHNSYIEIRIYP